ncbi:MAG: hypothetical protein ACYDAY_10040 [Candidatus Dormibacteria bacterium]
MTGLDFNSARQLAPPKVDNDWLPPPQAGERSARGSKRRVAEFVVSAVLVACVGGAAWPGINEAHASAIQLAGSDTLRSVGSGAVRVVIPQDTEMNPTIIGNIGHWADFSSAEGYVGLSLHGSTAADSGYDYTEIRLPAPRGCAYAAPASTASCISPFNWLEFQLKVGSHGQPELPVGDYILTLFGSGPISASFTMLGLAGSADLGTTQIAVQSSFSDAATGGPAVALAAGELGEANAGPAYLVAGAWWAADALAQPSVNELTACIYQEPRTAMAVDSLLPGPLEPIVCPFYSSGLRVAGEQLAPAQPYWSSPGSEGATLGSGSFGTDGVEWNAQAAGQWLLDYQSSVTGIEPGLGWFLGSIALPG